MAKTETVSKFNFGAVKYGTPFDERFIETHNVNNPKSKGRLTDRYTGIFGHFHDNDMCLLKSELRDIVGSRMTYDKFCRKRKDEAPHVFSLVVTFVYPTHHKEFIKTGDTATNLELWWLLFIGVLDLSTYKQFAENAKERVSLSKGKKRPQ